MKGFTINRRGFGNWSSSGTDWGIVGNISGRRI